MTTNEKILKVKESIKAMKEIENLKRNIATNNRENVNTIPISYPP